MRVLAVGAHPDDVDYLCGGTLARCAERGDEVTIAIATNGDVGSGEPHATRESIAAVRHAEARASATEIGAELIWMGHPDEFLFNDRPTRETFIDAIRQARPELMFIHSEADYHPDHRTAGTIGRDSRIPASVPLVSTLLPATDVPTVFVMDTLQGVNFTPGGFVDISGVIDIKRAMLDKHVSQTPWIRHVFGCEFSELMAAQCRFRGGQMRTEYAEGFQLLSDWPYTGGWELLP